MSETVEVELRWIMDILGWIEDGDTWTHPDKPGTHDKPTASDDDAIRWFKSKRLRIIIEIDRGPVNVHVFGRAIDQRIVANTLNEALLHAVTIVDATLRVIAQMEASDE